MTLIPQTITPLPAYPGRPGTKTWRPTRALRRRLRTPEQLTVSQWAERYRRVTEIDSSPGRWRGDLVPHLQKIMDAVSLPHVREVWICAPERAGKTQALINIACWGIDQGSKSGNIFWLMPTEADARRAIGERLIPVFRARDDHGRPGRVARYLSGYADDTARGMIRFNHGVRLFPAWSNSASSLASYFGRINIADECDKFATRTSEGSDPITLFRKRARDDRGRSKYIYASTPGNQYIYSGTMECQQVMQYHLRCPSCDQLINPTGEHLDYPADATAHSVRLGSVGLGCPDCGVVMDEAARRDAYLSGAWLTIKGADIARPDSVGMHMTALVLPTVPLTEIAQYYIAAQSGDLGAKIAWANGYEIRDYEPVKATEDYKDILALCDDRPRDLVPEGAACLVAEIDTQQNGFYYEIAAFGYAAQGEQPTSWLVSKGFLLTFNEVRDLQDKIWTNVHGKEYRLISALIDSGGTRKAGQPEKHSRTKEVYEFCKNNPLFKPVKGTGRRDTPVKYSTIERYPGTSKAIPGGLILTSLDVHYYKDELARRLRVNPDDPGAFVLYSGFTRKHMKSQTKGLEVENELIDYAKHLCAEYKNELGLWEHDKKAGRNDYHDVATYRMYHIDLVIQWGVLLPESQKPKRRRVLSKGVQQ